MVEYTDNELLFIIEIEWRRIFKAAKFTSWKDYLGDVVNDLTYRREYLGEFIDYSTPLPAPGYTKRDAQMSRYLYDALRDMAKIMPKPIILDSLRDQQNGIRNMEIVPIHEPILSISRPGSRRFHQLPVPQDIACLQTRSHEPVPKKAT